MVNSTVVRTRIAPSPTGEYHIGHIRTCLYDYALARQNNGQFVIRIENTDQKRYVPGSENRILQDIRDYGLSWDEGPDVGGPCGPYIQTERLAIYQQYIKQLVDSGHAYYCFCTEERLTEMRAVQKAAGHLPKYDRHCLKFSPQEIEQKINNGEKYVIRMRVPDNQTVSFNDLIRGEITFNTNDVDDQVLMKSNGVPTYQFAVVIDDHLMNITHIFRGEEWISSTPKQILLYRFFNWEIPKIAHLTVLMDPDGHGKMSKRHGSVSARSFLNDGYLPEALLNFLMLLGWNPGTNQEFFTLDEFVKTFSIDHLHKKSPIFDRKKLDYFNGYYLRQKTNDQLLGLLKPFIPQASDEILLKIIPLIRERIVTLKQAAEFTKYFFVNPNYDVSLLTSKTDIVTAKDMLLKAKDIITQSEVSLNVIQPKLMDLIKSNNWEVGDFFMAFRVAIAGATQTPPIVESLGILGKEKVISRLNLALSKLN